MIQGAGIISNSIKIKINGEIVNAKMGTYRNDKASAPTKPYTDGLDSRYMVSEQLALTIPLTAEFQTTQLWRDINTQSYNKIYDVEINYGISTNTKTMRLLTGIINIEEGRIASATVIFDNPLPRAELEIKYSNKETDEFLDGTVHLTTFGFSGDTAIDGRLQDKSTKGEPLRRTVGINFSFIFEKDNEMSTNLVNQIFYRDINARYNITVKMEGYEIILENLVMEKGEHSFSENPGVSFSVVFVEGVTTSGE